MSHDTDYDPPEDIDYEQRIDMRQHGMQFPAFFQWFMGGMAVIGTTTLIWVGSTLIALGRDVAVLKDRPPPVSQAEFTYRMSGVEERLTRLEEKR